MKTSHGFTLLELLVAITVLSVVSVIAWRGLDTLVMTRDRLEPEIDETRAMLVAFGQMERDLSQVVNPAFLGLMSSPLNVRPADGAMMIELARVAVPVPDRATEVQTVYYRVVDNTLVRQATAALPYFQRTSTEQFENARLLDRIQSMDVRLWQPGVGWTPPGDRIDASAPPGTPPGALRNQPAPGLEVILTRTDGRSFRRVFLVNA
ncbi:MAG: type II secretion system protein GspJ [Burkholderiaceae bacterium]